MYLVKPAALTITESIKKAVEEVDREVALLAGHASAENAADLDAFRQAWGRLLDVLMLGTPSPERRTCPSCGALVNLEATWCIRCRKSLPSLAGSTT